MTLFTRQIRRSVLVTAHPWRTIYSTPIWNTRKTVIDYSSDDLFASEDQPPLAGDSGTRSTDIPKLTPEERAIRFDQIFNFVSERVGSHPAVKTPQVRHSAWINLFGLATTPEQLEKVAELFPQWKDSRKDFTVQHAEMFVRRCEELQSPTIALKVFSDHSKYGIALSLQAARHLLYSLSTTGSLQDTISAAALYHVHNLPAVSEDLVSCSIFTSACFNNPNKHSLRLANAFLPHLRSTLERTEPLPRSSAPIDPALAKSNKWLRSALHSLQHGLARQVPKQDISWLDTWQKRSGKSAVLSDGTV